MAKNNEIVMKVEELSISFATDQGRLHAVRGVDFELYKGEVLAIVGESGSGKSVSAKTIMGILPRNGRIEKGKVMYKGEDLTKVSEEEFNRIRGRQIGMIFQDPLSSLNPIMKVGKQITEAIIIHRDKLKRKYNELIAPANIDYLNEITALKGKISDSKFQLTYLKAANKKRISQLKRKVDHSLELDKLYNELIAPARNAYQKALIDHRATGDMSEEVKNAKAALKASKHEAKQQVKNHEIELRKNDPSKEENLTTIKELRKHYAAEVLKHKEFKKQVIAEHKPIIASKKETLLEAKVAAKKEISAHKEALKKEYLTRKAVLISKRKAETDRTRIKAVNQELKELHLEFVDRTKVRRSVAKKMAIQVMEEVGIPNAARRYKQYPFEFSGGMRQRIVIAIALIQDPEVLICDEPTTALDVTIQAQILELILRLKKERQLSVIFITHDLGVVANMADRVAVMYAGQIVEYGTVEEIFYDPRHPYTWALLSSIPDVDSRERLEAIPGTPPHMIKIPVGDAFAPRSKYAMEVDYMEAPPNFQVSPTHFARTWLLDERAPEVEKPKIVSERIRNSLEKEGKKHG